MREIGFWDYDLRDWQFRAHTLAAKYFFDLKKKSFLADVTPAGGKTTFAMRDIFWFLQMRYALRVVVVVPTEHLKKQWAEAAYKRGIDLDPNFINNGHWKESQDYHGICVTYHQVASNPVLHKTAVDRIPTLVILDEIHHAGDEKTWGAALELAYENAVFVLGLTGTAFRSDNYKIPFVTYVNNVSKADFRYSYSQAVMDKVCRPIYFPVYDGIMKWKVDEKTYTATFADELDEARQSERLRTALDPTKSEYLEHVLRDANKKLDELRIEQPNAGALVLAIDQKHAKQIRKLLYRITDEEPEMVISEDKSSSEKISAFKNSSRKWIIAVKMISEGVDIPRLRVGVHATNITQDLFFRQEVGRFIRWMMGLTGKSATQTADRQEAYLFIPKDPRIVKLAREFEIERDHALNQQMQDWGNGDVEQRKREEKDFQTISAVVTHKSQYELSFTDRIMDMFNIGGDAALEIAANTSASLSASSKSETAKGKGETEEGPLFEKRNKLRDEVNQKAKYAVMKKYGLNGKNKNVTVNIDWEFYHKEWIRLGGKKIELESLTELERRAKWLEQYI